MKRILFAATLFASGAVAQTPPDLFVFEAGTPIVADEMNSNFQLVRDDIARALNGVSITQDDLITLATRVEEVAGTVGPEGPRGESLEFTWDGTRLGVKGVEDATFDFVDLEGPVGARGDVGPQGPSGADGANGAGLEFTWDGTQLGIRHEGDAAYTYVDLVGPQGPQGPAGPTGAAGADLEFAWNGTQLGVRLETETAYTYTDLVGPQGETGPQGVQGEAGPEGPQGPTGLTGPQGDPGPAGPAGADGGDGADGADGVGLNFQWDGTSLGVKRADESTYQYQDLQGPKGDPGQDGSGGMTGHAITPGGPVVRTGSGQTIVTASASCAIGKVVVGGGFRTVSSDYEVYLQDSYPSAPNQWTVRVDVVDDASIEAYAVCIDGG